MALDFLQRRLNRSALRSLKQRGSHIDRFKLTSRKQVRATLLADEQIAKAVAAHAKENQVDAAVVWKKVDEYIQEIVPFFNILAYYRFGYFVSRMLLHLFYKVSAEQ